MYSFKKHRKSDDYEAWAKIGDVTVCHARLVRHGDTMLIITINTSPYHRNRGLASGLVRAIQNRYGKTQPCNIVPEAQGFWDKLGLTDSIRDGKVA